MLHNFYHIKTTPEPTLDMDSYCNFVFRPPSPLTCHIVAQDNTKVNTRLKNDTAKVLTLTHTVHTESIVIVV